MKKLSKSMEKVKQVNCCYKPFYILSTTAFSNCIVDWHAGGDSHFGCTIILWWLYCIYQEIQYNNLNMTLKNKS